MHWGLWISVGLWIAGISALVLGLVALAATQLAHDDDRHDECFPDRGPDPDDDGVEVPNPIDLRAWGGRRSRRARVLEAERRAGLREP